MAKKIDYASLFTLRKDGRYMATFTDDKGRHYVYDKDPERLWHKMNDKVEQAEITFGEVADLWATEKRQEISERSWWNYAKHYKNLIDLYGEIPFSKISALTVSKEIQRAKARGYSYTVVNSIRCIFNMIFDYAVVHGYEQYNPVTSIKLPKGLPKGKRSAPSDKQIKSIFDNKDKEFGLFPLFLICTGLRKSEALALQWSDIDWKEKDINVSKSVDYTIGAKPKYKSTKTKSGERIVPILDVLYPELEKEKKKSKSMYIFPEPTKDSLMKERTYERLWLQYCKDAGLMDGDTPAIGAHNLRHGTATLMFEAGVDELTTQKILGHSRIEITREIYTDLRNQKRSASIKKLNKKLSKTFSA